MSERQYTLVLADEAFDGLETEKSFLKRRGFRVLTAPDGNTLLALAVSEPPDVVVLGQSLPGLPTATVCDRLKADPRTRETRLILVVPKMSEEAARMAHLAGADAFVVRSAGHEALLQTVGRVLHIQMRQHVRITVVFTVHGVSSDMETLGKAIDLSDGGLCLEVNRFYSRGSSLEVRFMLPGERQEIRTEARVAWISPLPGDTYALGLEFIGLSAADRSHISRFIEKSLAAHPVAP